MNKNFKVGQCVYGIHLGEPFSKRIEALNFTQWRKAVVHKLEHENGNFLVEESKLFGSKDELREWFEKQLEELE